MALASLQVARLAEIEEELVRRRRAATNLAITHRNAKLQSWFEPPPGEGVTIAYRDNYSDHASQDSWQELLREKAEIRILEDERDHLRFIMTAVE